MKELYYLITFTTILTLTSCSRNNDSSRGWNENQNEQQEIEKSPEELRAELKAKEEQAPTDYLSSNNVTLTLQRVKVRNGGLFREAEYEPDGALIEGEFVNTATLAKFKDIQVKIGYYSVTKSLIKTNSYTVYVFSEPNSSESFSFKVPEVPSAYDTYTFDIVGATAVTD